jgi:hypothetical protein
MAIAAARRTALRDAIEALRAEEEAIAPTSPRVRARRRDVNVWAEDFSGEPQGAYHRKIQALADTKRYLIVEGPPEVGKSQQLVLRRTLWRIGNDPEITVGIVGAKDQQAREWVSALRTGIESETFRETWPDSKHGDPWTTERFTVQRKSHTNPAPTVQGIGVGGQFLGARLKLIILDDILNALNTATKEQRNKVLEWVDSSMCMGRLVRGGQLILIGNTWTSDDAIHELGKRLDGSGVEVYHYERTPLPRDPDAPGAESPVPEIWSIERCKERRDTIGPSKWIWQYGCEPRSAEGSRFKPEWFETPSPRIWNPPHPAIPGLLTELDAIRGWDPEDEARRAAVYTQLRALASYRPAPGEVLTIGMDIGVGLAERNDQTAWVVMLRDSEQTRHVIYAEKVRMPGPALIARMRVLEWAYPGAIFRVETVAAQKHLAQFAGERLTSPIAHHTTTGSGETITSKAWGLEHLAVRFEGGQILIARDAKGRTPRPAADLIQGLLWYTAREHTADDVMALLLAEMQIVAIPVNTGVRMAGDNEPDFEPSEGALIYRGQA